MKRTLPALVLPVALILLGACAQKAELSREEQLKVQETNRLYFEKHMTRVYTAYSKTQLIEAAQKVLTLSDGEDVKFSHNSEGFIANRNWSWYAVLAADRGVDQWTLRITPEDTGGLKATLTENTISTMHNQQSIYVHGVGVMNVGTPTTTQIHRYNASNALYALFWRRMDYVLGQTKTWTTCENFKKEMETNPALEGNIRPLCGTLAKDQMPEELRPAG